MLDEVTEEVKKMIIEILGAEVIVEKKNFLKGIVERLFSKVNPKLILRLPGVVCRANPIQNNHYL